MKVKSISLLNKEKSLLKGKELREENTEVFTYYLLDIIFPNAEVNIPLHC